MPSSRPKRTWSTTTKQHQTQESQIVAKTGVTPHAKKKMCVCVCVFAAYLPALLVAAEYFLKIMIGRWGIDLGNFIFLKAPLSFSLRIFVETLKFVKKQYLI